MEPASRQSVQVNALGIPLPPGLFENDQRLSEEKALALYRKIVEKLAQEREAEHEKQAREKKEKEKRLENLLKQNPTDTFTNAVVQIMNDHSKRKANNQKQSTTLKDRLSRHRGQSA